jgi:hypothetical protein
MTNFVPLELVDLETAAWRLAHLVDNVPDDLLGAPTPCPAYRVGDLVDHVAGLALAFATAARKATADNPSPDASRLGSDWRARIPRDLSAMAVAWRDPSAWSGTTGPEASSFPARSPDSWRSMSSRSTVGMLPEPRARRTSATSHRSMPCTPFWGRSRLPSHKDQREGPFGSVVRVPDDAPLLAHVVGLSGRQPNWAP